MKLCDEKHKSFCAKEETSSFKSSSWRWWKREQKYHGKRIFQTIYELIGKVKEFYLSCFTIQNLRKSLFSHFFSIWQQGKRRKKQKKIPFCVIFKKWEKESFFKKIFPPTSTNDKHKHCKKGRKENVLSDFSISKKKNCCLGYKSHLILRHKTTRNKHKFPPSTCCVYEVVVVVVV